MEGRILSVRQIHQQFNKYSLLLPDLEAYKDSIVSHKVLACVSLAM